MSGIPPKPASAASADGGRLGPVCPVNVRAGRRLDETLAAIELTGFQGRALARSARTWERMIRDPDCTILMGYAGSLSVAGQYEIINWFLENGYVDVLVATGANVSEDIVDAMGRPYRRIDLPADDRRLFAQGANRYHDLAGSEDDYASMTELIADFYCSASLESRGLSSADLLHAFGKWVNDRGIPRSIVATAWRAGVPVFCPAIQDSAYGDAALVARSRGVQVTMDAFADYERFMGLSSAVKATGVVYIGGGVPKDVIQLFAVTSDLLFPDRRVPGRQPGNCRHDGRPTYYPHRYAVQITTDSPQWGGLSGCTFDEAVSWGKEDFGGDQVQCYCDATIALPLISQALAERLEGFSRTPRITWPHAGGGRSGSTD